MNTMQNRSGSAIDTCGELAALFETDAEWEAAEQIRVLLYYWLRGNRSAAHRIFSSLSTERHGSGADPRTGRSEIGRRIAELALLLQPEEDRETTGLD